jgi:ABC-2 type transport system ATP-binding protein
LHNIEKLISPFYSEWDSELYAHYLDRFSLEPKKSVKTLSRGMKVKLQIAVALSHNARMLILDEPTSGLDPFARDEICDLIREFIVDESKSVFFSTHITSDLEKIADYITLIEKGHIVFTETKDALLERYTRVTGGLGDINAEQKGLIIGYREHSTGFEGLLATADLPKLPEQVFRERASLEEVIINLNKGAIVE